MAEAKFHVHISTVFECSLERAFKTPILCDVTQIHTGFWIMPKVTHCTDDHDWGKIGSSKKVFVAKSLTQPGGFASIDRIIDRVENERWVFEVTDFQAWMLGFTRFQAEWRTTELKPGRIQIDYSYNLHSSTPIFFPLNWIFAKAFWRVYMKRAMSNVKKLVDAQAPYLYP